MSFFKEIASVLGLDEAALALGYNYVNYNGKAVYLEGVKKVLRIDSDEVAFQMPKGVLYIAGNNLRVGDLSGAAVLVCGEILFVGNGAGKERLQSVACADAPGEALREKSIGNKVKRGDDTV